MIHFEGLDNVDIVKKLSSKRNSVFLIKNKDNMEVIKNFNDEEFYKRELTIYKILRNEFYREINNPIYKIPQLIDHNDEKLYIKYQYILGTTLLNRFEYYEKKNDIKAGIRLLKLHFGWIYKFQKALTKEEYIELLSLVNIDLNKDIIDADTKVVSFIDINFRNFVIVKNVLYGFDFENVAIEKKIKDYSRSLAYMMLYNPVRSSYKKEILPYLLKELENITNISKDEIYKSYIEEIKKIEKRRALKSKRL